MLSTDHTDTECVDNTRIWARLLVESDLTLAKATTLALQIEICRSDNTAAVTAVRVIHSQPRNNRLWEMEEDQTCYSSKRR